jgi:chitodextrinase
MRQSTALRMPAWAFALMLCSVAVIVAAAGGATTSAAATSNGLVAAYSFDEGSGQSVADTSGNGNNGTISGASWTSAGKNGSALSFDGVSNQVTVADSPSLDLTDEMTLEAWVKPASLGSSWRSVVVKEQSDQLAYALYAHDGGPGPSGHVYSNGDRYTTAPSTLPTDTWTHLAATYDGSTVKIYVNGALANSGNVSGMITTSGLPLRIGGNSVWSEWFSGQIDDVRIYNRALDASELSSDMATPVGGSSAGPPADTQAPSAPGSVRATATTQTGITLAWNASTDDTGVSGYGYYRSGSRIANGPPTSTSYTFGGLACGTSYALAVDAVDAAGNRSGQSTVTASTSACATSTGLVAAYSFDQGAGQSVADDSGTGNGGTISGATWTTAGKTGGALSFDGAGDQVTVPDSPSLDLTTAMTLEAWIRPSSTTGWQTVVTKETSGNLVYGLFSSSDTTMPASIVTIGGSPLQTIARNSSVVAANTWTHLAATYDGTTLRLFIGGTQVGSASVVGQMAASTAPLRIGGNSVWPEWFAGQIDDLRIYNVALTPAQIQKDMTSPVGGTAPPSAALDTQAPTAPGGLTATSKTASTVAVSWNASTDAVGVTGYGSYVNGTLQSSGTGTTYTYTGLACGTSYLLAVDAYDAAGNRSGKSTISAGTSACSSGDTLAPTAPASLNAGTKTQSSVAVSWSAATDNVGVTGYGLYRDSTSVGSTSGTSSTFSALSCGTTYTFAVDAYDTAGNRSAKTSVTASTSACAAASGPGSANLWVDPSGGSCARQASSGSYVDAQACGSLQAAYNAAQSGDVVNIVDGSYTSQGLASGTKTITFRAAGPGRPNFGQIVSAASNVTVSGIQIENRAGFNGPCSDPDNAVLYPCGDNQTFDNVVIDGRNVANGMHGIRGIGNRFTLKNSEIRNIVNAKGFEGGSDDMVIENNYWHAITVNNSDVHNECMYVDGGNRAVFRGNRFIGCPTMALFFTDWNGGPAYGGVVVENNVFGHTLDASQGWHVSCSFKIGSGANYQITLNNWLVRYNTFENAPCVDELPGSGSQWYGNLGGIACVKAFSYRYNVGQTCGGTGDLTVAPAVNDGAHPNQAPFYVNAPAGDFHLKPGAAAIDKGDPGSYPATDKDGKARPVGSRADAGAYEYGA